MNGHCTNEVERESIILNSAWKMIDGMVNWTMFVKNEHAGPINLLFETPQHARLFIVLLRDFLSQVGSSESERAPLGLIRPPDDACPSDRTFIFHLRQVCKNPQLGGNPTSLHEQIEAFALWLEGEFVAPNVNFGAIDIDTDLHIKRHRYISMCGDIAKHHLARLSANVKHLRKLLKSAGHEVDKQKASLAIDDFFNWFFGDIFMYHSGQIAEFLNNIRWAIFEYLQLEYRRSWHLTENATQDFKAYSYHIPDEVTDPIARAMYWEVMNRVRKKPWVHRFVICDSLKKCY